MSETNRIVKWTTVSVHSFALCRTTQALMCTATKSDQKQKIKLDRYNSNLRVASRDLGLLQINIMDVSGHWSSLP